MPTVYCGHCGSQNDAAATFCGRCGTALHSAGSPAAGNPVSGIAAAGTALTCPRCGATNPASARFCGACAQPLAPGAALLPVQSAGIASTPIAYQAATQAQLRVAAPTKTRSRTPWAILAGGLLALMIAFGLLTQALQPTPPPAVRCPPDCPPPPRGAPLVSGRTYTSRTYGYSLQYGSDTKPSAQDDKSITWTYHEKSGGQWPITVSGDGQQGRNPQQVAEALQRSKGLDANLAYPIPSAAIGYNPTAYGAIYDVTVDPGTGQATPARLIVVAAARKNVIVEIVGLGPRVKGDQTTFDHPNPSLTPISSFMDHILKTVIWPGDNPL